MSVAVSANKPDFAVPSGKALGILAIATLACLAPFLNKAFCIDDPLFLWAAAQIQTHPLDFYGCNVNWYGTAQPLYDVMKNPPLASYYLAATTALFGTSEPVAHAAFLLPAFGAISGTWFLARIFCRQPVSAAVVALVTPAFVVSSTNLMCDTMMVCFWTWAIALWVRGLHRRSSPSLATASVLIVAAALTKYFAICLLPLLAVHTVLRARQPTWQLAWLLVPTAGLAAYQWWTWRLYGRGLLSDAAAFAWKIGATPGPGAVISQETVGSRTIAGLSFIGGSYLPLLFCAPWLWPKRGLAAAAVAGVVVAAWAKWVSSPGQLAALHMEFGFTTASAAELGLFTVGGALLLWLAVSDILKNESADSYLLAMWVGGTLGFAAFVNWTCNVRSVLPIAPALGILLVRQIDWAWQVNNERLEGGRGSIALWPITRRPEALRPIARGATTWQWGLLPAAALAVTVGWADFCLANTARTAAAKISEKLKGEPGTVWFEGHWGFQYYMLAAGGRDFDHNHPGSKPGDILINPYNNTDVYFYDAEFLDSLGTMDFPACDWLTTVQGRLGAGFYSAMWGPLPYVFTRVPAERYAIWRLKLPSEFKLKESQD